MRGARIAPGDVIIQHKIHYFNCPSATEAGYLVAILNAPCLARAFLQSRTSGRDFVNNPWRSIPIPRFDPSDGLHRRLARLCEQAEEIVEDWIRGTPPGRYGQVAASKRIRERLVEEGVFEQIDSAVRELLPEQAESGT